ncbi:MAG TPA: hypothetical protein VMU50_14940 [Polyangia bacterium]|jgi:hypothetical protein|nr:hypothetical protein [Polyangia bacterium]
MRQGGGLGVGGMGMGEGNGVGEAETRAGNQGNAGDRRGCATVAGIAAGDHWFDPGGNECVVTWVRRLGVLAYRPVGDRVKSENVVDIVRFVQRFRPVAAR